MDRKHDDGFEIIGDSADDKGERLPATPPLDLSEQATVLELEGVQQTVPAWQRWGAVVGIFVVGLVAGAGVWDARSDALLATERAQVSLVAGSVHGVVVAPVEAEGPLGASAWAVVSPGFNQLAVSLLNAGRRDVEVLSVNLADWEVSADDFVPQHVPAGEWADVGMAVRPVCDVPVPRYLAAEVRTDSGETAVTIPLPPGWGPLDSLHDLECDVHGYYPEIDEVASFTAFEPGIRHMVVRVWLEGAAYVTDATATQAGFRASGVEVRVAAMHGAATKLKLAWRIVNCADTRRLDELAVTLELVTAEGTVTREVRLPHEAIAMLARFAAKECGP